MDKKINFILPGNDINTPPKEPSAAENTNNNPSNPLDLMIE